MSNARNILQGILDDLGCAVMTDDWQAFHRRVILPFEMVTERAEISVIDAEMLRAGYDEFQAMLRTQRVTDYIRLVEKVEEAAPDMIRGTYVTNILSNGKRILPAYRSLMELKLHDGQWRVSRIVNRWTNDRWPILTPAPTFENDPDGEPK